MRLICTVMYLFMMYNHYQILWQQQATNAKGLCLLYMHTDFNVYAVRIQNKTESHLQNCSEIVCDFAVFYFQKRNKIFKVVLGKNIYRNIYYSLLWRQWKKPLPYKVYMLWFPYFFPLLSSVCLSVRIYAIHTYTCGGTCTNYYFSLKIVQLTNFLVFNFLGLFIYFVGE